MKTVTIHSVAAVAALFLAGCQTLPPGAEPGPRGTMAFNVLVEASEPGARIEANGQDMGNTPVHIKIFGDPDGTFHDFGSPYYLIRAFPLATNQFEQVRYFGTGQWFGPEDHIPERVHFDMNQKAPAVAPYGPPGYPYYGPPAYYYGPPYYYGPSYRFYIGPGYYHHHHRGIHRRR